MIGSEPTVAKQPDAPPEGKLTDIAIGPAFATVAILAMAGWLYFLLRVLTLTVKWSLSL
ncbi:hypothetical protein [Bradyrhizobium rifense]|uniref:hypothetical protein n=1 Tax=Bradyrhizobium rifense TaxID=515499 RepID=UPI0016531240|nr:hypothetical protein [Bradyrhizobium rifense]